MTVTKKVFQQVANVLADHREPDGNTLPTQRRVENNATIDRIARKIANILAEDNPAFDRDRFLRACGQNIPLKLYR